MRMNKDRIFDEGRLGMLRSDLDSDFVPLVKN